MYQHALITGGSGFVGSHFLRRYLYANPQGSVSIVDRSTGPSLPRGDRIAHLTLDLTKEVELDLSPDIVFHLAGEKHDESKMWETNREGTRRLLEFAIRRGVKRFVYLSSVGVYGAHRDSGSITEETFKTPRNPYEKSKSAAEDLVKERCAKAGLEYLILQPSNVIGIAAKGTYPLLGMMRMVKRGLFAYFNDGTTPLNYVSVADVAEGIFTAAARGAPNSIFILNTPVNLKEAIGWIADEIEVPSPTRRLPAALGLLTGELASLLRSLSRKNVPFSRERFHELTNSTRYEGGAISAATGFTYPFGVEATLRQLVRHYKQEGLL